MGSYIEIFLEEMKCGCMCSVLLALSRSAVNLLGTLPVYPGRNITVHLDPEDWGAVFTKCLYAPDITHHMTVDATDTSDILWN
jgi:hypothetical protein